MNEKQKLISGGYVITMNQKEDIYEKGWVLLSGDRISDIGCGAPPQVGKDVEIINASGKAIMPGIVNIHTHVCGSLFKALTEDNRESFYGLAFPMERFLTEETTYLLSMLGCIETVKFGSTCINDLYHYMRSTAKAVEKIGLRGVLAQKIYEVDLCNLQYNDYSLIKGQGEEKLTENIRLIEEYHGKANGRIQCRFGPHATDTVSMEMAHKIRELAEKYNVGIHIHVAQKEKEVKRVREI
ncbi:MAG: amidohydrolase family protein, partial [Lachnospiraceae bacterium]|nr:amidohydrolase family protein [Lachnospiraceae bacterium]